MKLYIVLTRLLITKRVVVFSLLLLVLSLLFFIATSNIGKAADYQTFFSDTLENAYFQNSFVFLKWMTLINALFLCSHAFAFNSFDGLFIGHQSKYTYITTKLFTIIVMNLIIVVSIWLSYVIVSQMTLYYELTMNDFRLGGLLLILGNYYIVLTLFFYVVFKHVVGIFIPLVGFIISFILTDSGVIVHDISGFLSINHLLFPDIIFTITSKIQFLHSFLTISLLTILYIVVILEKLDLAK